MTTANGRSESDLIYDADGTENQSASRRVVFKFRLTDEQMVAQLQSILEGGSAASAAPTSAPTSTTAPAGHARAGAGYPGNQRQLNFVPEGKRCRMRALSRPASGDAWRERL